LGATREQKPQGAAAARNITGQLKALDSICEELALAPAEKHKNSMKRMRTLGIYRSAWMGDS
jgi:hypothetical protein